MDSFCTDTIVIWRGIGEIIHVIRLVIPVIIVIFGTFDLGRSVIAGEDKEIKKSQKMFIKRLVYGVLIFFLPMLIKAVFSLFDENYLNSESKVCYECATNVRGSYCEKYKSNYIINPISDEPLEE